MKSQLVNSFFVEDTSPLVEIESRQIGRQKLLSLTREHPSVFGLCETNKISWSAISICCVL